MRNLYQLQYTCREGGRVLVGPIYNSSSFLGEQG